MNVFQLLLFIHEFYVSTHTHTHTHTYILIYSNNYYNILIYQFYLDDDNEVVLKLAGDVRARYINASYIKVNPLFFI